MFKSLLFKLIGAFVLVIAIGALVISWMTSRATQNAFVLYSTRSGQAWGQQLAPALADYFAVNGSWQGVETILQTQDVSMMTPGQGRGAGWRNGRGMGAGMGMMDQRFLLLDPQGSVIFDTNNELIGQTLRANQINNGTPITANGNLLGTLIVSTNTINTNSPAGQFLQSVNQSIWISVGIAGLIAVLLGSLLFFQITAPIKKLKNAAHAIAAGDLQQRVDIRSKDELGELGHSFNHMAGKLAEAETLRRNMVADVAHELRTPLAVIQANLEGIEDGVLPMDIDQVNTLHEQTLLLNRLVADLRLLSIAEAGQLKLNREKADPGRLITEAAGQFSSQAEQRGIRIITSIPSALPLIIADGDRVRQILANLIDNAMRYTPKEGTIHLKAVPLDHSLKISVTDSGSGIAPEDLPHIFERFYRADPSRTRASGGSGLGLAIVRQIVEAHGGTVGAVSPVIQKDGIHTSTEIWFTLPIKLSMTAKKGEIL